MPLHIRVPASSANLGPGFDALGLALGCYLDVTFTPGPSFEIQVSGRDAEGIPTSKDNLVWRTALDVAKDYQRELPTGQLHIHNDIPLGKGLGSSAAALVAGVV